MLGRDRWSWGPEPVDLSTPDPPIPTFAETFEDLAARLRQQIGTVRRTRDLEGAHPRIQKLLDADEHRRARQAETPYPTNDAPVFETSFEKRRLRILNSLLPTLDRMNVSVANRWPRGAHAGGPRRRLQRRIQDRLGCVSGAATQQAATPRQLACRATRVVEVQCHFDAGVAGSTLTCAGTPAARSSVADVCRRPCIVIRRTPAALEWVVGFAALKSTPTARRALRAARRTSPTLRQKMSPMSTRDRVWNAA